MGTLRGRKGEEEEEIKRQKRHLDSFEICRQNIDPKLRLIRNLRCLLRSINIAFIAVGEETSETIEIHFDSL